ncbi:MAG: ABC transporter substrate-binding protein [Bordetella sp.]|uniref:ABC transporter substrate-binding protein n=1 Tax=Bordetella sp. TaxID=28081 RepID=UPI003F7BC804
MKSMKLTLAATAVAALFCLPAMAQVKIGVISSATGPTALVGIPQKNTVPLLPTKIGDLTVQYIAFDDGSDTTASVTDVKKLISEDHVDAIIGPTGTPNAMGVIQFVAEAGVPMLAPVGGADVVLPMTPQKKWVFKTTQNDDIIATALVDHMVKTGIKTLGLIGLSDPFGENWFKVVNGLAAKAGIKIVAQERFSRADTSVTGQALRILAANPQAVLVAAPGAASVLPEKTLVDQGYKGQFYQTHGAALPSFLKLGGKEVNGTILAASLMLVLPEIPDSNPSKAVAEKYIDAYKKLYNGQTPATFGANVYDAGLLLERAIPIAEKAGKPGTKEFRSALRDALEQTKNLVGTQGVYNMTPEDHSGFDERGRELIIVKDGQWKLLK